MRVRFVRDAEEKGYFDKALVGGANWIKNANIILLLLADMVAYKSPAERQFMPYLDAGFIGMAVYCACESLGVGCCFVNPNVLDTYEEDVSSRYNKLCGAIALGNYDKKPAKTPKRSDVFEDK
uniref:Putative nitroreductase n=1 Tax=viral metagenome TaxID=1070528 RepID=A0A6M3ISB2_9ZZZZ